MRVSPSAQAQPASQRLLRPGSEGTGGGSYGSTVQVQPQGLSGGASATANGNKPLWRDREELFRGLVYGFINALMCIPVCEWLFKNSNLDRLGAGRRWLVMRG
jgi:hypothetical protein